MTYLELIAHFRAYGNVRFEMCNEFKRVYTIFDHRAFDRFELEYELNNGNSKLRTLR